MKPTDEWETPQSLFDELNKEFNFLVDLAANANNAKLDLYFDDFLNLECRQVKDKYGLPIMCDLLNENSPIHSLISLYDEQYAWLNPPYSNPFPFIKRAWDLSKRIRIVCLVKVDPSTKWWAIFWDYDLHQPKSGCKVRFLPKRVKFVYPGRIDKKINSANFPNALIIMNRTGCI